MALQVPRKATASYAIIGAGCTAILLLDLVFPVGVAAGVPYIAVVLFSLWTRDPHHIFATTALATALTILGFFFPYPEGPQFWIGLENRVIALFAIWATALLGMQVLRGENILRKERDFNRNLIETAPSVIAVLDAEYRIVLLYPYGSELLGRSPEEVRGRDWFGTCIPARERPRVRAVLSDCLERGVARHSQFPLLAHNSSERMFSWTSSPIREPAGTAAGVLSIGHDISELLGCPGARRSSGTTGRHRPDDHRALTREP